MGRFILRKIVHGTWLVGISVACTTLTTAPWAGLAKPVGGSSLVEMAGRQFPDLTRAARTLLSFADKGNVARDELAIAGPSAEPLDPSNDPLPPNSIS